MTGLAESNGPSYISAHSADVILSDIRPIKLTVDALLCINALLDEFLYNILNTACSLSTDKLRASLLGFLPTSLGKEALLEAEVELRAYWERTRPVGLALTPREDDSKTFDFQWTFELLRLKCEAYSTLNESDEDAAAELFLNERLSQTHEHPPKPTLVAPASLYLTAILEAICEHILSNVGRVAARDSSRTVASVNDLFIALCEDDSIYGLFKSMKVYEQIEQQTKQKPRRSKSFTRNNSRRDSQTSSPSPHQDMSLVSSPRSRISSDGGSSTIAPISASRSSFEKNRTTKTVIATSKISNDGHSQSVHKKSESFTSEGSKYVPLDGYDEEDASMLQEFDDLMRSTPTVKMSLTPDRLKTMEVHKHEKDQRGNRRGINPLTLNTDDTEKAEPFPINRESSRPPSRQRAPLVDSIAEYDEEVSSKSQRNRGASFHSTQAFSPTTNRTRTTSSSGLPNNGSVRSMRVTQSTNPGYMPAAPVAVSAAVMHHRAGKSHVNSVIPPNGPAIFPQRTRTRQVNRESLDLDDVMNGSDDESFMTSSIKSPPQSVSKRQVPHAVSASTRDLMDFLNEGPPQPPVSKSAREFMDFLAEGPPVYGNASAVPIEPKPKSGRLQRMISKLNISNTDKSKAGPSEQQLQRTAPTTPIRPSMYSVGTLPSLANRPIPPKPPRPYSPPPSPPVDVIEDDTSRVSSQPRKSTQENDLPHIQTEVPAQSSTPTKSTPDRVIPRVPPPYVNGTQTGGRTQIHQIEVPMTPPVVPAPPTKSPLRNSRVSVVPTPTATPSLVHQPMPSVSPPDPAPGLSEPEFRDMQRLIMNARTADECRLILDMFMARSDIPKAVNNKDAEASYPTPSPSLIIRQSSVDEIYEQSLVELLLGVDEAPAPATQSHPHSDYEAKTEDITISSSAPESTFTRSRHVPTDALILPV